MEPFAERLNAAIRLKKTPAMVGIDPVWARIPHDLRIAATAARGETLAAVAHGYREFSRAVVEQVANLVPIVKFQSAFFEAAGPAGMAALHDAMQHARDAELLVVLDGKRNDIGNTAAAYAEAFVGTPSIGPRRAWPADALTVNPYLGEEGIEPFLRAAERAGNGLFVLVRTSNPGAGKLQDLRVGERTIYQTIADWVETWSIETARGGAYGAVGAVVGATVPEQAVELRKRMPHVIFLVPGYGAQGGTSADAAGAFDRNGLGAVVNNSRGILYAYQESRYAGLGWRDAVATAAKRMIDDLAANTPAGQLRR